MAATCGAAMDERRGFEFLALVPSLQEEDAVASDEFCDIAIEEDDNYTQSKSNISRRESGRRHS